MERTANEITISISPTLECQWRWRSTSALACILDEQKLPAPSTSYSITIPKNFDLTRGEVLKEPHTHTFTTHTPEVNNASITNWKTPALPVFQVEINQKVSKETLVQHMAFVGQDKSRVAVLVADATPSPDSHATSEEIAFMKGRYFEVTPERELSADTGFTLNVSPGIQPERGNELGQESRAVAEFYTFPPLRFIGISCRDTKGTTLTIPTSQKTAKQPGSAKRCDPLNVVQLAFSAPVLKDALKNSLSSSPDLRGGRKDFDPWDDVYSSSGLNINNTKGQHYFTNLPYGLKAYTTYTLQGDAAAIRDQFGRTLAEPISISFLTDHRSPRYVLDNEFSVLEKESDSQLPVVVNNVDSLKISYQALTSTTNQSGLSQELTPYKAQDIAYRFPIDIRGLLKGRSGVVQGTLTTKPATPDGQRWFFSQVTPYGVHAKLGHFNSLVWVTSLATGQVIEGAKVSIITDTLNKLQTAPKELSTALTDQRGIAMLAGTAALDPKLELLNEWENMKPRLIVRVEKDGELALVPITWDTQVYAGDLYPNSEQQYGHIHTWGTTAQGLYKAGDTVQFVLWVRDQNNDTFTAPPLKGYKLKVLDPTDTVVFEAPEVTLSEFGAYSAEFTTKPSAAVGWYRFVLTSSFSTQEWQPLRVLISDFTPAPFRVSAELNAESFRQGQAVAVSTQARLHAGGPYSNASVRVSANLRGAPLEVADTTIAKFSFESELEKDLQIFQKEEQLDSKGDHSAQFTLSSDEIPYGNLVVESAVRDDRGKFVASFTKKQFIGRDRYVGLLQNDWVLNAGREAQILGVVIDGSKVISSGNAFSLVVSYEETKAARVKSAGNTYITRYEQEFVEVSRCELVSQATPVQCAFTPQKPGRYKLSASVKDSQGRQHTTNLYRWAGGTGDVIWQSGTDNELPIIPEKKQYKVGETARFFIRNPYPGAQALLTTERYGVQRSWVQTLADASAVIELPVTADHIPGFFFSATVTSPRVEKAVEDQVDLGKPSFKMGYVEIPVVDPAKQLQIEVKPRGEVFKPRETVIVDLSATTPQGKLPPLEYAVTVLDEAVFDLISQGKDYFNPYRGFYTLDALDVRNYNLIKILLGRQKFEKKGASAGGDGGSNLELRSIKKFVSYWNPSIKPDEQGRATISFQTPDNLTSWKVFTIAVTKDDQMGLGEGIFRVNKETEIRSALPNQVRAGDRFMATFTVMNRTNSPRTLNISADISGAESHGKPSLESIAAEPFKRYSVAIPVIAGKPGEMQFTITAVGSAGGGGDKVQLKLPILTRHTLQTAATFGSSDGKAVSEPVTIPANITAGSGTLGVVLSSSVLGNLDGAFTYMKDYPFECWEQQLSKAVVAAHYLSLAPYLPKSFQWAHADELVKSALANMSSFQTPSGALSFFVAQDEYANQYLSAYTALALGWLRERGYTIPQQSEAKLHTYLQSILKGNEFPPFYTPSMQANVRATALAALAKANAITSRDLQRYTNNLKGASLFGKAALLEAALALNAPSETIREVIRQILNTAQESSGKFTLSEVVDTASTRILSSEMRSQCAVLDAFLSAIQRPGAPKDRELETVVPKLVRSITLERKRKERWENTQENTICVRALAHYSEMYEKDTPHLDLSVDLGEGKSTHLILESIRTEPIEVSRPLTPADAGRSTAVNVSASGQGRFYHSTRLTYATSEPKSTPTNAGMEVFREYSVQRDGKWVLLSDPITVKQGELIRVDLYLKLPTARNFVVVNDPVPGGLEAVNRDLATTSSVDAEQVEFTAPEGSVWWNSQGWVEFRANLWSFYHKELHHSAARFYSEYLPSGNYRLSYVAQAIASGEFAVPSTHAEEMYDPDIFGESAARTIKIEALESGR
jgi:uncharacterized protein YfaS (alpha-2-macroglobulin family)